MFTILMLSAGLIFLISQMFCYFSEGKIKMFSEANAQRIFWQRIQDFSITMTFLSVLIMGVCSIYAAMMTIYVPGVEMVIESASLAVATLAASYVFWKHRPLLEPSD